MPPQATQLVGPQNVGAAGGVIPFWAAAQDVYFDNFTSDTWTPGASVANMFQGSLADLKAYGFVKAFYLKLVASTAGSTGGTFNADAPANFAPVLRVVDPNGHALIDADSFGLYLLNKYGARSWLGDPFKYPNASPTGLAAAAPASPVYELLVPFTVNQEIGLGALSDMDASGPYRLVMQGNTQAALFQTNPTTTTPTLQVQVGGEFFSLPSGASRVNGQPQVQLPPLLDRGVAVVNEFSKQTISGLSAGGRTYKIPRVGNIMRQVILVARNSAGARIDWLTSTTLAAGTRVGLSFDSIPLWDIDPQHAISQMMRRRTGSIGYDTGVLMLDRGSPNGLIAGIENGLEGGLDDLLQTAQTTALEITLNAGATLAAGTIDVYTSDITVTNMVTGEKYAFAYGGQLLLPSPPGQIRS